MPLPAGYAPSSVDEDGARAFKEREERARDKERAAREDNKPKREEWMLVPPKEMDLMSCASLLSLLPASVQPLRELPTDALHLLAALDTTKLKSRGFATGKAAQSAANKAGPSNLWTETPAERQQRLEDEALGRKRRAENAPVEEERDDDRRKRIRDQQLKAEVERHNVRRRRLSLSLSLLEARDRLAQLTDEAWTRARRPRAATSRSSTSTRETARPSPRAKTTTRRRASGTATATWASAAASWTTGSGPTSSRTQRTSAVGSAAARSCSSLGAVHRSFRFVSPALCVATGPRESERGTAREGVARGTMRS